MGCCLNAVGATRQIRSSRCQHFQPITNVVWPETCPTKGWPGSCRTIPPRRGFSHCSVSCTCKARAQALPRLLDIVSGSPEPKTDFPSDVWIPTGVLCWNWALSVPESQRGSAEEAQFETAPLKAHHDACWESWSFLSESRKPYCLEPGASGWLVVLLIKK